MPAAGSAAGAPGDAPIRSRNDGRSGAATDSAWEADGEDAPDLDRTARSREGADASCMRFMDL
jgi:hypothetical protein